MKKQSTYLITLLTLSFILLTGFAKPISVTSPVFDTAEASRSKSKLSYFNFFDFVRSLGLSKNTNRLAGIYASDKFSFEIMQQPAQQPAFVSEQENVVTQFSLPQGKNSFGLLAHNNLAGADFSKLSVGEIIVTIDEQYRYRIYEIQAIEAYQATSPYSPYSNFIDLDNQTTVLSSTQLFQRIYTQDNTLVLQTCIAKGNEPSWGRLFVIAREKTDLHIGEVLDFSEKTVWISPSLQSLQ